MKKSSPGLSCFLLTLCIYSSAWAGNEAHKLALNWKPEPQFGGFYDAQTNGAFKKRGLEVKILEGGAGTPTIQMLAAKQLDFAVVSGDEIVMSRAHGTDVVALFAVYQTHPQGIMIHPDAQFKSIKDIWLGDGVIALQKGLPYVSHFEKVYGPAKATIVPYLGGIGNFLKDPKYSQQCFVTSEPLSVKKSGTKVASFLIADSGFNPYATVVATRGDVIKSHPKLVADMVAAIKEGWTHYLKDPSKANQVMSKLNAAMDTQTFIESGEAQKSLIESPETHKNGLGKMTLTRWKALEEQLFAYKVIQKHVDPKTLFKEN